MAQLCSIETIQQKSLLSSKVKARLSDYRVNTNHVSCATAHRFGQHMQLKGLSKSWWGSIIQSLNHEDSNLAINTRFILLLPCYHRTTQIL